VVALFEAGLEEDEREEVRRGLSDMGAVEVAKCFGVAEQLAEGYVVTAEALDHPFKGDVRIHPAAFEQDLERFHESKLSDL